MQISGAGDDQCENTNQVFDDVLFVDENRSQGGLKVGINKSSVDQDIFKMLFEYLQVSDAIPFVWPSDREEREEEVQRVYRDLFQLKCQKPHLSAEIDTKIHYLETQGPYFEMCSEAHPMRNLLHFLTYFQDQIPVRKVNLNFLNFLESEIPDPFEEHKKKFNLVLMSDTSFPKLQKLLCDLYQFGNQKILHYQMAQVPYVDYLKLAMSTLKKAFNSSLLDEKTKNWISNYGSQNSELQDLFPVEDMVTSSKIVKLRHLFDQLQGFRAVNLEPLLQYQDSETGQLQDCIWNRQQLIQCIILFCLIQCEALISNVIGSISTNIEYTDTLKLCTDDVSWNENCWCNIRDYLPKLADKLHKRYKIIRQIPTYDKQTRTAIIYYAKSLLGYYIHTYNHDCFNLSEEIKYYVREILAGRQVKCDLGLVLIVANARMYVQLMYGLK